MTELQQALFAYAQTERIAAMLSCCDAQELEENSQMADAIKQEASFLAGLSIGLELSRL